MKALCLCWCNSNWEPGIQPQILLQSFPARSFFIIMKQEVGPELCKASLGVLVWRRPCSCALACFLLFDCPASLACWSSSELQPCSLFASLSRLCPAQCVRAEPLLPGDPGSLSCLQPLAGAVPGTTQIGVWGWGEGCGVWPEQLLTRGTATASPNSMVSVWTCQLWCSQQCHFLSTGRDQQIKGNLKLLKDSS